MTRTPHTTRSPRRGFTLVEILIVVGILMLLLGLSVAALNAISGNRSTAAASNLVSAMLARARTMALNDTGPEASDYGVFFFLDRTQDRTAMVLVKRTNGMLTDADGLEQYKGWKNGWAYLGAANPTPPPQFIDAPEGQRVLYVVRDALEKDQNNNDRLRVAWYQRTVANPASDNSPPATGGTNAEWADVVLGDTDSYVGVGDTDIQYLPAGIGLQLVNEPRAVSDRYLRTGAIFFDRQGRLDALPYAVRHDSKLGIMMKLTSDLTANVVSQFGVALFDLPAFGGNPNNTEGDLAYAVPGLNPPVDETAEETWIDTNALVQMVNRANGTLNRGE